MTLRTPILTWLTALLLAQAAIAAPSLRTLKLKQQRGEDVAAALEPLLEPGERVAGLPDAVVISAEPIRQAELARLVAQLDSRRRQWRLEVDTSALLPRRHAAPARPNTGRVDIGVWRPGGHGRPGVGVDIDAGEIPLGSRPAVPADDGQWLVVAEGGKARVDTGPLRPAHWVLAYPDGRYSPRQPWQTSGGGFWLQARADGDEVVLTLAVSPGQLPAGRNGNTSSTRVRGRPDAWLTIASVVHEADGSDTLVLGQGGSRYASTAMVRVRLTRP
ncbi:MULTISPECIES: secretin N-terminal domain-containing protein [Microvirgula]|uniref:NolW-like domain-containing protein n=1 Tax=Microvirgula aerodenitrificans TaxID=57480 RepID=A0A2S0PC28_9NEIS|nr:MULTISPECIES: secretin N-terminal domain-containing protein [Microvirgula]AVY94940.1 hypothetical protein DAI18_13495 [Microvirgula aerodenitrificans]RAS10644.1 hypothetical protein DFO50_1256 [Microvirgula sp. AG722]